MDTVSNGHVPDRLQAGWLLLLIFSSNRTLTTSWADRGHEGVGGIAAPHGFNERQSENRGPGEEWSTAVE